MSIKFQKQNDRGHILVEDEMTIYTAAEQKQTLLEHMSNCEELELDLSAVTEIDSAGLQILMLLKNEARSKQKELRIVQHSPPVIEAFELLSLSLHFGDPIIIPADRSES